MIAAAFISFTFLTSCKKDKSDISDNDEMTANAEQFGDAEGISADIDNIADEAMLHGSVEQRLNSTSQNNLLISCATVTNDSINQVITIDFGTGCPGHDGRIRSGQIIIHYSGGTYFTTGFQRVVTFNAFYVNSRHIEGMRTITNNGVNASGHINWSVNVQSMRVTQTDGSYHLWNSLRVREMISGDTLLSNPADDIYSITGSSSGINSNGNSCSATITNPLIKRGDYRYIVSGTVTITPSARPQRTLDYGNGSLDDIATVTRNGNTHIIHLH